MIVAAGRRLTRPACFEAPVIGEYAPESTADRGPLF